MRYGEEKENQLEYIRSRTGESGECFIYGQDLL